jgi:hypothetical protein
MACLRLVTVPPFPPLPDFSVPRFSLCIARLTLSPAALPYFRDDPFLVGIRSLHFGQGLDPANGLYRRVTIATIGQIA